MGDLYVMTRDRHGSDDLNAWSMIARKNAYASGSVSKIGMAEERNRRIFDFSTARFLNFSDLLFSSGIFAVSLERYPKNSALRASSDPMSCASVNMTRMRSEISSGHSSMSFPALSSRASGESICSRGLTPRAYILRVNPGFPSRKTLPKDCFSVKGLGFSVQFAFSLKRHGHSRTPKGIANSGCLDALVRDRLVCKRGWWTKKF